MRAARLVVALVATAAILGMPVAQAQDASSLDPAVPGAVVAVVGGLVAIYGLLILLGLALLGLWIWALVDCIQRQFPGKDDRMIWLIVLGASWVVGLHGVAAIVYLIAGRPKGWKPGPEQPPQAPPYKDGTPGS